MPSTTTIQPAGTIPPKATTSVGSTTSSTSLPIIIDDSVDTGEVGSEYGLGVVVLDGRELLVAIADTSALRSQGLMDVSTLGELDGMVFIFDSTSNNSFWMWTVPISLDVAFFDADGHLVDAFTMEPCVEGESVDCPRYRPDGPYRYALETVEGSLTDLTPGSAIDLSRLFEE